MKSANVASTFKQVAAEPFEALRSQFAKPIGEEAIRELGGFFGHTPSAKPKEIASEDLKRAREKQDLDQMDSLDKEDSQKKAQTFTIKIQEEYRVQEIKNSTEQKELERQFVELKEEVSKLAKTSGINTKAHLETQPSKIGILDIKRLKSIVKQLTLKVEESKSAQELVSQRTNAKKTTGMLAWVNGKQMKVHEQGTLQLQG